MNFTIKKANEENAPYIHQLLMKAFKKYRDFYTKEGFEDTVLSGNRAKKRIRNMNVYVAIDNEGRIIGTIGWQKVNNDEAHLRGMAVHPKCQGNGVAEDLLKKVETDVLSKNLSKLTLDTTNILQRAQHFYRKHGFKKTGKIDDFFGRTVYEFAKTLHS